MDKQLRKFHDVALSGSDEPLDIYADIDREGCAQVVEVRSQVDGRILALSDDQRDEALEFVYTTLREDDRYYEESRWKAELEQEQEHEDAYYFEREQRFPGRSVIHEEAA